MFFRRNRFSQNVMDPITRNLSSEMKNSGFLASRPLYTLVEVLLNILQNGENQREVIRMCKHMEVWFFNPLCSNGLSHTD